VEHFFMAFPQFGKLRLLPAVTWLVGCPALLAFSLLTERFHAGLWWELYFLAVTVMSPVAFAAYGWDNWKAKRETSRIAEKTLHLLAVLGGWPGAVLGQTWFRHKTIKPVFRAILIGISLSHIGLVTAAGYARLFGS
jgi:uncharacterized membrane protein YsdA (DUF1294 family)